MLGFISDLHLEPLDNERTQAFYNFEEVSQKYESLYILGDLFEYWIGDDDDSSVILQIKVYIDSQKGVGLFFIHGNRDFLIGDKFASESNVKILDDMDVINFYGKKIMLSHGDAFCTDDVDYQKIQT